MSIRTVEFRPTLNVVSCGDVDDGKSTLFGRLIYESGAVPDDVLREAMVGATGDAVPDLSRLFDGLLREREQGITIDVAYRVLWLAGRRVLLADSPGHVEFVRNLASAASRADAAVMLVDVRHGVTPQTRSHAHLIGLLGVRDVAFCINKIDLVDYSEEIVDRLTHELGHVAQSSLLQSFDVIPVSALKGDNVVEASGRTPWYKGPTLYRWIETRPDRLEMHSGDFCMPVQIVLRPSADTRAYAGTVIRGHLEAGCELHLARRRDQLLTVKRIFVDGIECARAGTGDAASVVLGEQADIGRGDVLTGARDDLYYQSKFSADIVWLSPRSFPAGTPMLLSAAHQTVRVRSQAPLKAPDSGDNKLQTVDRLGGTQVVRCDFDGENAFCFDAYDRSHDLGGFYLIDEANNETLAAGLIRGPLAASTNVTQQSYDVGLAVRSISLRQRPLILWMTGLPASGKSTLANALDQHLSDLGFHTAVLDGDNLRLGLNSDLSFSREDRDENLRRIAEVARLMAEAGLIVIVATISPHKRERSQARRIAGRIPFLELFVNTPIRVCRARDPKGLYARADAGLIQDFTGVSATFEAPERPDVEIDGGSGHISDAVQLVFARMRLLVTR